MKRKTKSFNEMLWENEDSLTLEEIKKEIKEYKDDQSFCINGLNNIKSKYILLILIVLVKLRFNCYGKIQLLKTC